MKREFLETIIIMALKQAPKNPEKAAQFTSEKVMHEFDRMVHKYYQRKYKAFRYDDIDARALLEVVKRALEEYPDQPATITGEIEDELGKQLNAFYGDDE